MPVDAIAVLVAIAADVAVAVVRKKKKSQKSIVAAVLFFAPTQRNKLIGLTIE